MHGASAWPRWLAPLGLAGVSFALYAATLPTTVSFEDSAEYVTASAVLGIPHPSGYPLYVLLGRVFAALPFGTVPWRLALFSAVCAAAALAVLYLCARAVLERGSAVRVTLRDELALLMAFGAFGVSSLWWSQAVYAKVYALQTLLLALVTWSLLRWRARTQERDLFMTALWFGLACSNHLFLALLAAPGLFVALRPASFVRSPRRWALLIGGGLLGLLPYLYLLWRMPTAPYATLRFNGVHGWLKFIARSNYSDVGTAGLNKFGFVADIATQAVRDLGALLVLTAAACTALWRRASGQRGLLAWFGMILATPLLIVALRSFGYSPEASYVYRVYAVPSLAIAACVAAIGAVVVVRRLVAPWRVALFGAVLASSALLAAWLALPVVRITTHAFVDDWTRQTLASLPPDAVLVVGERGLVSDTLLFGIAQLQVVEGLRRDVTVVTDIPIHPFFRPAMPPGAEKLELPMQRKLLLAAAREEPTFAGRPLLTSFPPETVDKTVVSRATGFAFALDREATLPDAPAYVTPPDLNASYVARDIVSHLRYLEAARVHEVSGPKAAMPLLSQAMALDTIPMSLDYIGFIAHRAALAKP